MFMTQRDFEAERSALEQLEFYGFWLWNYSHNKPDYFDRDKIEEEYFAHLDKQIRCDTCSQRREFCFICDIPISEKKRMFLDAVFTPGIETDVSHLDNSVDLRLSSEEILNYYYLKTVNSIPDIIPATKFRYVTNSKPTTFRELEAKEIYLNNDNIKIVSKKEATLKIDLSMPFEIIINEMENYYYATNERTTLHFKDIDVFYNDDYGPKTSYRAILKNLKTYDEISFSASAYEPRALGFWLWDTIANHKAFRTVPEAINFLRSGEKFPKDVLEILGYSGSEKSIFNRLFRLTASCIASKEVCSIG